MSKKTTPNWLVKARKSRKGTDLEVTLQAFGDWSNEKIAKQLNVDVEEVKATRLKVLSNKKR